MHKNNFYISFGVWLAIIPFLGVPGSWRNTLVFLSGLFLILVSVGPIILKKLQIKEKSKKRPARMADTIQSGGQNERLKFSVTEDAPMEMKTETEAEIKTETGI